MDAASATGVNNAQLMGQIQMALLRKSMDVQQMQGAEMIKLIQSAGKGLQGGDALAAQATGLGSQVDTYG